MKRQKGFTLIELLIVVAIIGIIAAIAIPSLLRARVSANEAAGVGDTRTVLSAQATYFSSNSNAYDSSLVCLLAPSTCIPIYPPTAPVFLDSMIASELVKLGYARSHIAGPAPTAGCIAGEQSPTCVDSYIYYATPSLVGQTGVRGFGGDMSGFICFSMDGSYPNQSGLTPAAALDGNSVNCRALK